MTRFRYLISAVVVLAAAMTAVVGPAFADDDDWGNRAWRAHERREHAWRDHERREHESRERYGYPAYGWYAPGYGYAQPPVIYAPPSPPPVTYAPAPGFLSLGFTLR